MPATTRGRIARALIDLGFILALFAVVVGKGLLPVLGFMGAYVAVTTVMMALTGATLGGLITGIRLRRVGDPSVAPGWAAVAYLGFLLLTVVPTAGLGAVALWLGALKRGEHRTWFDRMAGTVLLSSRTSPGVTCSLVFEEAVIPVSGPLVLGRRPSPLREHPGAQLITVLQGDSSVSKTHVLVLPAPDGVYITDLGSTNGTHIESDTGVRRLSPGQQGHVGRGRQAYLGDGVCVVR